MTTTLAAIHDEVRTLKLDDSLLALNHILSVSRRLTTDPTLETEFGNLNYRPRVYIVHFLAKQLLLHASNLGHRTLDFQNFIRLTNLCISLDDPIEHDPNWKHADPTGFFERIITQQLRSQVIMPLQRYGLALGLFRDVGVVEWPETYDLRADIERELGVSVEQFIAMGHVCLSLQLASHNGHKCMGTFTPMYLAEAFGQGLTVCVPEVWTRFLPRVACDRDTFRQFSGQDIYKVNEPHFAQFEFNPLHRFPIIEVIPGHFVGVDPYLIVERATLGLFYDLFERDGIAFTVQFGHSFDRFIGQLLSSVCPKETLWSASQWEQRQKGKKKNKYGKIGDWAFAGRNCTVLFECKSLRPSLELTTYGTDDSVQQIADRIASALEQLVGHSRSIQERRWESEGLRPGKVACVVVTYGRVNTVNGPFTRKRIHQRLADKGVEVPPFVVLSLEELDVVVRLVELGRPLDEVVLALAGQENSFDVLRLFDDDLKQRPVSTFAYEKGKAFMDGILPRVQPAGLNKVALADS